MTPGRARAYAKAVLVPLVTAGVVAWNEHRTAQNKERQDAVYAVTAPVLKSLQDEQARLADRIDTLTKLVTAHVIQHPGQRAEAPPPSPPRFGAGSGGQSAAVVRRRAQAVAVALGQEQVDIAKKLKAEPALTTIQRSIPASPDEAMQQVKK